MPILDVWPNTQTKGPVRALYNLAINRLCAGLAPESHDRPVHTIVNGREMSLFLRASSYRHSYQIAIRESLAVDIKDEKQRHPGKQIAFFALWRDEQADDTDNRVSTWCIPIEIVEQTLSETPNRDKAWDVLISNTQHGRWTWSPTRCTKVDVTSHYDDWLLNDEELRYVNATCAKLPVLEKFPTSATYVDGTRQALSYSNWTELLIEVAKLSLRCGVLPTELSMRCEESPFMRSRQIAESVHIRVGDADSNRKHAIALIRTLKARGCQFEPDLLS